MIFDLALMTLNQIHDKSLGRKQSLCKVETFDVFFFFLLQTYILNTNFIWNSELVLMTLGQDQDTDHIKQSFCDVTTFNDYQNIRTR